MGKPVDQPRAEAMTRLGSYEIVRKLARGGMAELFLARTKGPEGFEKLVVLKKILPNYAENPKFVRLFLDEAKLVATLDHPHIAHVYDMGKVDGNYFFTMEYVHGQDVRTTLRRVSRLDRLFPVDHAVQIARNVAAALHYAHESRRADGSLLDVVHRDVSPSNILISYDGTVKLVDFGVAKAATSTVKTRTGTLKGKISYMSPEQAKGSPIDRRSDIFSLGIVLWEMVTTQRLFKSDNDLATIQMIINSKAQPPSQLRPEVSPELDRIVMRALASNNNDRYQTAEQLQLDLEELAREQKLKQSTVALRTFMHELFEDEIKAWSIAKESGHTLTDHLISASMVEGMTTPISESELESDFPDDDDDDDEVADSEQGTAAPSTTSGVATQQISVPPPPLRPTAGTISPGPPSSVHVLEQTPPPGPLTPLTPVPGSLVIEPSGGHRGAVPTPVVAQLSDQTPFPLAPLEWRTPEPTQDPVESNERRNKQLIIGASVTFGLIVLVAIMFGGGGNKQAASKVAPDPEPTESNRVEMKSSTTEPPPVEPTPTPVETEPTPAGSANPTNVAPVVTKPTDTKKPRSTTVKPTAKPLDKPTDKTPKPITKPKPDKTRGTKPWDPNSALPPP